MTKEDAILTLFKSFLVTKKHEEYIPNKKALTKGVLINDKASKKAIDKVIKTDINYQDIKTEIITNLLSYISDNTGRKPIILPVVMNVKKSVRV